MLGAYDDLEALAEVCSKHKVTNIPQIDTQSIAMHLFPWIGPRVLVNLIFRFGCMWTLAGEGQQFFQGTQSSYQGGIKCRNQGTGFLDSEGSHR